MRLPLDHMYGENSTTSGLKDLVLGGGYLFGSILCTFMVDRIYA